MDLQGLAKSGNNFGFCIYLISEDLYPKYFNIIYCCKLYIHSTVKRTN